MLLNLRTVAARGPRLAATAAVALQLCIGSLHAEETRHGADVNRPLAMFDIEGGGDIIVVPVMLDSCERLFAVDTGFSATVVDVSLRELLGVRHEVREVRSPGGALSVPFYRAPSSMTVGGLEFESSACMGVVELDHLRRATGHAVYGILGMDFLGKYVIQIDPDDRKLRVFEAAPRDLGDSVPLQFKQGVPYVTATINLDYEQLLFLDTGYYAPGSVALSRRSFERFVGAQRATHISRGFALVTLAGAAEGSRIAYARSLTVGNVAAFEVRIAEVGTDAIGLTFFARFKTTFDFPGAAIHLKAGRHALDHDYHGYGGLNLWIPGSDRRVVVRSVAPNSPAAKAHIQPGDSIMEVNGADVSMNSLHQVRMLLRREYEPLRLTIERGGVRKLVHLKLASEAE